MKKVAIVFQTHNLEEFAVKNFRLLKEKLPHNYDLFLSVDVDHYKQSSIWMHTRHPRLYP